jgi:hypothetical protein
LLVLFDIGEASAEYDKFKLSSVDYLSPSACIIAHLIPYLGIVIKKNSGIIVIPLAGPPSDVKITEWRLLFR